MTQSRFALCSIDKDISALQIRSDLNARRESGAAHTYDTRLFYQGKLIILIFHFDRYKLFLLLFVGSDNDPVFQDFFNYAVHTGKNIRSKTSRRCDLRTFFHFVPCLYNRCTGCTDMLTQ